ncbi:hypothetical protein AB1Y20_021948 [Prymnesium parvum]|uniref:Uncharacterized protein n=1 Tax=Prymnesium parvum TaxID=97485 RepID=A0AB34JHB7_PRYPA
MEVSAHAQLTALLEERLGGMMLIRLELSELVERLKHEEHALATSLKSILALREREREAFARQLEAAQVYARQLEAQLRSQGHDVAAPPAPPHAAEAQRHPTPADPAGRGAPPAARPAGSPQAAHAALPPAAHAALPPAAYAALPPAAHASLPPAAYAASPPAAASLAAPQAIAELPAELSLAPPAGRPSIHAAQQLQLRLAKERSHIVPRPAARSAAGPPPKDGASARAHSQSHGSADPFDLYSHSSPHRLEGRERRLDSLPSPAVVTAEGAAFHFNHT